jgi:metallo-beta-lactamase class B
VPHVRLVKDQETLRAAGLTITAHFTPGHTPGGTSWTWRSCEGTRCLDMVYADSLSSVSAPGFRFTGDRSHPGRIDSFSHSIEVVAGLPCDVLMTPHPESFDLETKLERRQPGSPINPFIDPQACKAYAANAKRRLELRVAAERAEAR